MAIYMPTISKSVSVFAGNKKFHQRKIRLIFAIYVRKVEQKIDQLLHG
jgi:hypothetical protein